MTLPAGAANRIVSGDTTTTWQDLALVDLPGAAAVFVADDLDAARVVWTHATGSRETLVAAASRAEPGLVDSLLDAGLAVVHLAGDDIEVTASPTPRPPEADRVWLLTSGTTGRPKRVGHTLASLTTVGGQQPPRTWLCPYTPGAYAWWQVVTLSLNLPGQDIVFVSPQDFERWPELARRHGVTAASGTPTFWRQALLRSGETLREVGLQQVTLGGEPVDQGVLDLVHEAFPAARVSWIYASSEAGAAIAVHDGRAGFPAAWLDRDAPGRPRLRVDGDELLIASPHRGAGIDAELHTGDRVQIVDDRVLITGRLATDEINVGGSKVSAAQVREVLLSHPGVAWAAVKGRRAPLVGTVVAADVVLSDPSVTEAGLAQWCAARLAEYAVPRRFRMLDSVPISESLKSDV
ncbi:class I adenylate-forming enzyme family protein [Propionicicella superfundia]|uniref:class I adenylate-forming enzyme family protein n=1 Tax=Propionicicella superfundia TaxID=348582 RepID=UPI0003F786F1|nr:AMP-binding protein [Propionicicella superfundia]